MTPRHLAFARGTPSRSLTSALALLVALASGCLFEVPSIDDERTTEDGPTTSAGEATETGADAPGDTPGSAGIHELELVSLEGATAEVILLGEDVLDAVVGCGR